MSLLLAPHRRGFSFSSRFPLLCRQETAAIAPRSVPQMEPELAMPPPKAPTAFNAPSSCWPIFSWPTASIA